MNGHSLSIVQSLVHTKRTMLVGRIHQFHWSDSSQVGLPLTVQLLQSYIWWIVQKKVAQSKTSLHVVKKCDQIFQNHYIRFLSFVLHIWNTCKHFGANYMKGVCVYLSIKHFIFYDKVRCVYICKEDFIINVTFFQFTILLNALRRTF